MEEKSKRSVCLLQFLRRKPSFIPPLSLFTSFISEEVAVEFVSIITSESVPPSRMYRLLAGVHHVYRTRLSSIRAFDPVQPYITYGKHAPSYSPLQLPQSGFPRIHPVPNFATCVDKVFESISLVKKARNSAPSRSVDNLLSYLPDTPLDIQNLTTSIRGIDVALFRVAERENLQTIVETFLETQKKLLKLDPSTPSEVVKDLVRERESFINRLDPVLDEWKRYFEREDVKGEKNCSLSTKLKQRFRAERGTIQKISNEASKSITALEILQVEVHGTAGTRSDRKEENEREEETNGDRSYLPLPPPVSACDGSSSTSTSTSSSKGKGEVEVEEVGTEPNGSVKKLKSAAAKGNPVLKGKRNSRATRSSRRSKKKKEKVEKQTPCLILKIIQTRIDNWAESVSTLLDKERTSTHTAISTYQSVESERVSRLSFLSTEVEEKGKKQEMKQSIGERTESAYQNLMKQLEKEYNLLVSIKEPAVLLKDFPFETVINLLRSVQRLIGNHLSDIARTEILFEHIEQVCDGSLEAVGSL